MADAAESLGRRLHPADAFAEADPHRPFRLAPRLQSHLVAILEEAARFPRGKFDRLLPTLADFEERPEPGGTVGREGARPDQIAGLEIAAVRAVMGDDLRRAPVHCR